MHSPDNSMVPTAVTRPPPASPKGSTLIKNRQADKAAALLAQYNMVEITEPASITAISGGDAHRVYKFKCCAKLPFVVLKRWPPGSKNWNKRIVETSDTHIEQGCMVSQPVFDVDDAVDPAEEAQIHFGPDLFQPSLLLDSYLHKYTTPEIIGRLEEFATKIHRIAYAAAMLRLSRGFRALDSRRGPSAAKLARASEVIDYGRRARSLSFWREDATRARLARRAAEKAVRKAAEAAMKKARATVERYVCAAQARKRMATRLARRMAAVAVRDANAAKWGKKPLTVMQRRPSDFWRRAPLSVLGGPSLVDEEAQLPLESYEPFLPEAIDQVRRWSRRWSMLSDTALDWDDHSVSAAAASAAPTRLSSRRSSSLSSISEDAVVNPPKAPDTASTRGTPSPIVVGGGITVSGSSGSSGFSGSSGSSVGISGTSGSSSASSVSSAREQQTEIDSMTLEIERRRKADWRATLLDDCIDPGEHDKAKSISNKKFVTLLYDELEPDTPPEERLTEAYLGLKYFMEKYAPSSVTATPAADVASTSSSALARPAQPNTMPARIPGPAAFKTPALS